MKKIVLALYRSTLIKVALLTLTLLIAFFVVVTSYRSSTSNNMGGLIDIAGRNRMLSQQIALYTTLFSAGDKSVMNALKEAMDSHESSIEVIKNGGDQNEGQYETFKSEIDKVESHWANFKGLINQIVSGKGDKQSLELLKSSSRQMLVINNNLVKALVVQNKRNENSLERLITGVVIVYIIFFVTGVWITVQNIVNPLNEIITFLKQLGKGDLTNKLEIKRRDEMGYLKYSLNKTVDNLADIVVKIEHESFGIKGIAEPLNENSKNLSLRASDLAATFEEISAAMEEMTSSIDLDFLNTENAAKASQEVLDQINTLKSLVTEGTRASKEIDEKVSMINEIAGQTNLLALNAAIEASRAGVQGKGFSVVAKEVQELAEISKASADEITKISGERLKLAEEIERFLNNIVDKVIKSSESIEEIANSSKEQRAGTRQIHSSMMVLQDISQTNESSAEDVQLRSNELATLSNKLKSIVSSFEIHRS